MSRFAAGGVIPGPGGEFGDEVPALLRGGCEIILTRRQLLRLGCRGDAAQDRTEDREAGDAQ